MEKQVSKVGKIHTLEIYEMNGPVAKISRPKKGGGCVVIFHTRFLNMEALEKRVMTICKNIIALEIKEAQEKADRLQALKNASKNGAVEVGQIYYYSWGYDQTNIDYFQVVYIKGQTVKFRQICQTKEYVNYGGGNTMPKKDSFWGDEITKRMRLSYDGNVRFSMDCGILLKWEGKAMYFSDSR